jgi:UDP-N-acetylmuramoylalanine--D-glutamate ligase
MREKRVAILGLARSGTALAAALAARGIAVAAGDRRSRREIDPTGALQTAGVALFPDGPDLPILDGADLLAISPGVPLSHPVAAEARRRGIPVVSELEVAWRLLEEEADGKNRWIAVTGTNGKSTVASWIAEILRRDGRDVALAGNIGTALSTFCSSRRPRDFVVETSSFQLEAIDRFRADVAVVTNVTPDHLDRHGSLAAYAAAKARVFENQEEGDAAVVNEDDRGSAVFHPLARRADFSTLHAVEGGVWAENGSLWSAIGGDRRRICAVSEVALPGLHNLENALASAAAAELAGASVESVRSGLTRFAGLPHRSELVTVADGVAWIDDSKGTNPDAVVKSLAGYPDGRVVLILGGSEKGSDFSILAAPVARKARLVLTIGQSSEKIERSLAGVETKRAGDMERAVDLAASAARPGDTVLLSPACASFDQYRNYEERGDHFRGLVLTRVTHGA